MGWGLFPSPSEPFLLPWRKKGHPSLWAENWFFWFYLLAGGLLSFFFSQFQVWIPVHLLCCSFVVGFWDHSCKCTWRAGAGMLWLLVLSVLDRSCCFGEAEVTWQIKGITFLSFSGKVTLFFPYMKLFTETYIVKLMFRKKRFLVYLFFCQGKWSQRDGEKWGHRETGGCEENEEFLRSMWWSLDDLSCENTQF